MAEVWGKRFKTEIDTTWPGRKPFGINYIRHCQTPTFSIGVGVEFLIFTVICLFSVALQNYFIWMGAFIGISLHMILIHVPLCFRIKHYVPGVMTSLIFFVPSVRLIYQAILLLHYDVANVLLACLLGAALVAVVIPLLHKSMGSWSEMLYRYSKKKA